MPSVLELLEHPPGLVVRAVDRVAAQRAVVLGRVHRRLRHGVHRVRRDQVHHVHGVGEGRVLDAGRGPQRPLDARAARAERRPAGRRRTSARTARRRAARWPGRPVPRSASASGVPILSSRSSTSVSTRLTKKDATEARPDRSCPAAAAPSRPAMNASMTSLVALQREDQGHVDADALGQALGDGRKPGLGRRDLDEQVGPVDQPPQRLRLGDGLAPSCRWRSAGRPRGRPGRPRRRSRRRPGAARRRPSGCRRW